jgi:hypothetical protein
VIAGLICALWEKGKVTAPKWADRLLRALYREHMGENVKVRALVEKAVELEASDIGPIRFEAERAARGWQLKAA